MRSLLLFDSAASESEWSSVLLHHDSDGSGGGGRVWDADLEDVLAGPGGPAGAVGIINQLERLAVHVPYELRHGRIDVGF